MIDLGSLIPSEEAVKSTWSSIANDPVARVALMNFGTRLMVGGGGSPIQEIGAALGHAGEGVAKSQEAILAQQNKDAALGAKKEEAEANRKNQLEVAKIGASSREEVANIRSAAMLERAALIRGPQTQKEFDAYINLFKKIHADEKAQQIITRKSDDDIAAYADLKAKEAVAAARAVAGRGGFSPLGGPDTGLSSQNSPPTGTGGSAGGTVPGGQSATGGTSNTKPSLEELSKNPKFVKALDDPKFIEQLKKERPDLFAGLEMPRRNEAASMVDDGLNWLREKARQFSK